jgi:hypothetical protein
MVVKRNELFRVVLKSRIIYFTTTKDIRLTVLLNRFIVFLFFYESIKPDLQRRPIYECRCNERLKTKVEEFTRLTYTGLFGGLEHLKIETRLIDEKLSTRDLNIEEKSDRRKWKYPWSDYVN